MITEIVNIVNDEFKKIFASVQGVSIHGLTELFQVKNKDNSTLTSPGVVSKSGEINYVGVDDKNSIIIYHRLTTASQTERTGSSYGDSRTDIISTFNNSIFIYADRKKVCEDQISLFELIQTSIPEVIRFENYKSIIIRVQGVNFNTKAIFNSEYAGADAQLRPERLLIQINYSIETTAKKKCLSRCA